MTHAEELAEKVRCDSPYALNDRQQTALSELVAMADCDCIPFVAWSLSCPKCGRIAAMTQERFQKFIAQAADAEALAEAATEVERLFHLADWEYTEAEGGAAFMALREALARYRGEKP